MQAQDPRRSLERAEHDHDAAVAGLAQVGDAGAKRYEKRLAEIASGLERQRDELSATLEQRFAEVEGDLRRREGHEGRYRENSNIGVVVFKEVTTDEVVLFFVNSGWVARRGDRSR